AFRVAHLDALANVIAQILGRHQPHYQFAGVERDVDLRVNTVKIVEHLHVQIEVVDWHVPVFRHDQVQADDARVGLSQQEAGQDLGEDLLFGKATQDLVNVASLDTTSGISLRTAAFQGSVGDLLLVIQAPRSSLHRIFDPRGHQLVAKTSQVVIPADF